MSGWFINDCGLSRFRKQWYGHGPNVIDLEAFDVSPTGHLVPKKGQESVSVWGIEPPDKILVWLCVVVWHVCFLAAGAGLWAAYKAVF